jgi:SAM-dependent methyltransferase
VTGHAFAAAWLALREPYDARARDNRVTRAAIAWRPAGRPLAVADLGCGTGANLRFLGPRLGGKQHWQAIDSDEELLARLPDRIGDATVEPACRDLADPGLPAELGAVDLITASALLDLVGTAWIDRIAGLAGPEGPAFLFALSYSGGIAWTPPHRFDAIAEGSFDRHQRGDKGLGPALGPTAVGRLTAALEGAGHGVLTAASDWRLGPADAAIQSALLADMARVWAAMAPGDAARLAEWRAARLAAIDRGQSALSVAHRDLFAAPAQAGRS